MAPAMFPILQGLFFAPTALSYPRAAEPSAVLPGPAGSRVAHSARLSVPLSFDMSLIGFSAESTSRGSPSTLRELRHSPRRRG